jgi:hypothetical protein
MLRAYAHIVNKGQVSAAATSAVKGVSQQAWQCERRVATHVSGASQRGFARAQRASRTCARRQARSIIAVCESAHLSAARWR